MKNYLIVFIRFLNKYIFELKEILFLFLLLVIMIVYWDLSSDLSILCYAEQEQESNVSLVELCAYELEHGLVACSREDLELIDKYLQTHESEEFVYVPTPLVDVCAMCAQFKVPSNWQEIPNLPDQLKILYQVLAEVCPKDQIFGEPVEICAIPSEPIEMCPTCPSASNLNENFQRDMNELRIFCESNEDVVRFQFMLFMRLVVYGYYKSWEGSMPYAMDLDTYFDGYLSFVRLLSAGILRTWFVRDLSIFIGGQSYTDICSFGVMRWIIISEIYFIMFIVFVIFRGMFPKNNVSSIYNWQKLLKIIIIGFIIEILLLLFLVNYMSVGLNAVPEYFLYWDNNFYYSKVIVWVKIFICVLAICYFISIWDYFNYEQFLNLELPIIMLLCIEGMFLLLISNNLFLIYLGLELQSLALYVLASVKRYSNLSIEAGLKYYIFGSFASGLLLYGISLIYGFTGTTNLYSLYLFFFVSSLSDMSLGLMFGYTLVLIGIFFKLGIVPFHSWLVDVYDGSPLLITYFFSIIPKISVLVLFYRIFFFFINSDNELLDFEYIFTFIIITCCLFSLALGSVGALFQTRIKRMLGYSAIVNLGYVLLGFSSGSYFGIFSAFYYFFIYILLSINIFAILVVIRRFPSKLKVSKLREFVSITNSNFLLSMCLTLCLLSLAGIPPLIGFFGKFFVFMSLIAAGHYLIVLYSVLLSVVTCVYYIRLVRFILFEKSEKFPVYFLAPMSPIQAYFVSFITLLNVFFFFFQGPIIYVLFQHFISFFFFIE